MQLPVGREPRASDEAYDRLLEMILDLRIPPGSAVNEQQVAAQVGLGRMPVREALARLAGDRFITILPRRGTVVTALTLDSVIELFEAREAVECGIAHIAARRTDASNLASLRRLTKAADRARKGADAEAYLRTDHEVHAFLVGMVRNSLLQDAAVRLLQHNLRFWRSYWSTRPAQHSTMLSHTELLAALEDGDPQAAEQAMRDHIAASRQLLQSVF